MARSLSNARGGRSVMISPTAIGYLVVIGRLPGSVACALSYEWPRYYCPACRHYVIISHKPVIVNHLWIRQAWMLTIGIGEILFSKLYISSRVFFFLLVNSAIR